MKLEIDIPSIIYNDAKENRGYISVGKMEIAWKAIADGKPLEQEPTTKNDIPHCQCTDAEIAKSFIEDVEAVKEQLPCGEQMDFPSSFDEFAKDYGFKDKDEIYTNGSELIPVFRVKQWLEHISTTKNDLGVASGLEKNSKKLEKNFGELDCISRADALNCVNWGYNFSDIYKKINILPSVTPQEPRWIPVSERLPDTDDEVLCWYEYYHWSQGKVLPEYGLGRYFKETKAWFGEVANGKDVRVIAWMPLPEPYKENKDA